MQHAFLDIFLTVFYNKTIYIGNLILEIKEAFKMRKIVFNLNVFAIFKLKFEIQYK